MRIDIDDVYHKTDDKAVFTGDKNCEFIWLASRTLKNGYDCSVSCEVELNKDEVIGIVELAKAKGWV